MTGNYQIPLKGLIVANAVIDYRSDPHIFSIELFNAFNLIPLSLYEAYKVNNCIVPWTLLWFNLKIIPQPDEECLALFLKGFQNI